MIIHIESNWWRKIISYAKTAHEMNASEVSGMAPVIRNEQGQLEMQEPVILKQTASLVETTLDVAALHEYHNKCLEKYAKYLPDNILHCWWHSHHVMEAYWSGTDQATIEQMSEHGPLLALVVNNQEDYAMTFANSVNVAGKDENIQTDCKLVIGETEFGTQITDDIASLVTTNQLAIPSSQLYTPLQIDNDSLNNIKEQTNLFQQRVDSNDYLFDSKEELCYTCGQYTNTLQLDGICTTCSGAELDAMWNDEIPDQFRLNIRTAKPVVEKERETTETVVAKERKKPGPTRLKGVLKKLEIDNLDQEWHEIKGTADVLENAIYNILHQVHTAPTPLADDKKNELLSEINKMISTINRFQHQNNLPSKYHTLVDFNMATTLPDLLVKEQGETDNEPDYSEVSKHIPTGPTLF